MSKARPPFARSGGHWLAFTVALLAILLGVLATLQYRWIGNLSRAERERMQATLDRRSHDFVDDFDREITRAFVTFELEAREPLRQFLGPRPSRDDAELPDVELARRLHGQSLRWETTAVWTDLVSAVYVASRTGQRLELRRYDPETGSLTASPWPSELLDVRSRLVHPFDPPPQRAWPDAIEPGALALMVPIARHDPRGRPRFSDRSAHDPRLRQWTIVQLDRSLITEVLLPELAERHFGDAALGEYELAVLDRSSRVLLYGSAEARSGRRDPADATLELFSLRPFSELFHHAEEARPFGARPRREGPLARPERQAGAGPGSPGLWQLELRHRQGSLAAAVDRLRRRNLATSAGILLLLAGSMLALVAATRRAQRLARQQLEFVAGITHELNTPLAAIRSAGANLADGVVTDPAKIKRYGSLILREGKRLTSLVGQALEFAGLQAERPRRTRAPLELAPLLERVIADCDWLLEEYGTRVELDIPATLPPIAGDRDALARVFENLLTNAVKYGARPGSPDTPTVEVRARASSRPGRDAVRVEVKDHGPGIPAGEQPQIFEPFFRGRAAAAGTRPGSGLGLYLVRQLVERSGGRVSTSSSPQGTTFTVELPVAAETLAAAREAREPDHGQTALSP